MILQYSQLPFFNYLNLVMINLDNDNDNENMFITIDLHV